MLSLPQELHCTLFNFCDFKDIRSLSLVNKNFNSVIKTKGLLLRSLCLESSPNALPLENSWKKRWEVMSDFSAGACNQYSINLTSFFDLGLRILPNSPSFFQDEVLLINKEASQIYRCNYLTNETKELDCKTDDKIHQIYCSGYMLAIASGTGLIIYDLKNNQTLNRYDKFSSPGWIKFFDGNRLVYFINLPRHYYLFKSIREQPDILNEYSQRLNSDIRADQLNEIYYDGQFFIRKDASQSPDYLFGVDAIDYLNKKFSSHSVKFGYIGKRCSQAIINSNLFTFATHSTLGGCIAGTEFNLNSYENKIKKFSEFKTVASFKMKEYYQTTALHASKDHFIVGLTDVNKHHSLAFWNYKNQVILFESAHEINHLIVNKGAILTSDDGQTFTLFDFTGKGIAKPSVKSKFQVIKSSNFLMEKIKDVTNYLFVGPFYRYIADVNYFYYWGNYSSIIIRTGIEGIRLGSIAFIFYKTINFFFSKNT